VKQKTVAECLGIPQSRVSEYMHNKRPIPTHVALKLRRKFGWSLDYTLDKRRKPSTIIRRVWREIKNN
jgi:plasmid maintenance system antidote protein VapI